MNWPPNIDTDYEALWPVIALRNTPPGPSGDCVAPRGNPWNGAWVKQFVRTRNVWFQGTGCVAPGQAAYSSANIASQGVGLGGQAGNAVFDTVAAGSAAIPFIGLGISAITSIIGAIFAHHAQAVKNEQEAQCQVYQICGQSIPAIDAAVQSGQITAQQGMTAHAQVVAKCKSIIAPVSGVGSGGHPCNAGCCYGYFLDCLQDFCTTYYVDLAPPTMNTVAPPASAPTVNRPVINSLSSQQIAISTARVVNPPTEPSPSYQASVPQALIQQAAPPPGSPSVSIGVSMNTVILAVLVVVGVIVFAKFAK